MQITSRKSGEISIISKYRSLYYNLIDNQHWSQLFHVGQYAYIIDSISCSAIVQKIRIISCGRQQSSKILQINRSIVKKKTQNYDFCDQELKQGVSESSFKQTLRIKIVNKRDNELIFGELQCKGIQIKRKIIGQNGNGKSIELYPKPILIKFINSKLLRQKAFKDKEILAKISHSKDNIDYKCFSHIFYTFRLLFYQVDFVRDIKQRLTQILAEKEKEKIELDQLRVYLQDSSIFSKDIVKNELFSLEKQVIINLNKEVLQQITEISGLFGLIRQQTKYFSQKQKEQNETFDTNLSQPIKFVTEMFPGKLLRNQQSYSKIYLEEVTLIIEQYNDLADQWVFPMQPEWSTARSCSYCMKLFYVYIKYDCNSCQTVNFFCSQLCQYQFRSQHSCKNKDCQAFNDQNSEMENLNDQNSEMENLNDYYDTKSQQSMIFLSTKTYSTNKQMEKQSSQQSKEDILQHILEKQKSKEFTSYDVQQQKQLNQAHPQSLITRRQLCQGIYNIGNTCFMNSSLQMLLHSQLSSQIQSRSRSIGIDTTKDRILTQSLFKIIKIMEKNTVDSSTMKLFKKSLDKKSQSFRGFNQHDAHEFIMVFLSAISEELKVKPINNLILNSNNTDSQKAIARNHWLNFIQKNNSPIQNLFYGQLISQIKCPYCNNIIKNFTEFNYLSVNPSNKMQLSTNMYVQNIFLQYNNFSRQIHLYCITLGQLSSQNLALSIIEQLGVTQQMKKEMKYCLFKTGLSGDIREIIENDELNDYFNEKHELKDEYNQLFVFQAPVHANTIIKYKFTLQSNNKPFTFKRPLFFMQDINNITNAILYNAIIQYFLNIAKCYQPMHKIGYQQIYRMMISDVKSFFSLHDKQGYQIPTQDELIYQVPIGTDDEIVVRLKHFHKNGEQKLVKFYEIITKKFNKFTKAIKILQKQPIKLKMGTATNLIQCLREQFTKNELLDKGNEWRCQTCNQKRRVYKKTKIYTANRYLLIHLNRFKQVQNHYQKNQCPINIPISLNLQQQLLINTSLPQNYYESLDQQQRRQFFNTKNINTKQSTMFSLQSTIMHNGTKNGGHYYALAVGEDNKWREYNDSDVFDRDIQSILKTQDFMEKAYILLYKRVFK